MATPKPRLLLVDDVPGNVSTLASALGADDYEMIVAINGQKALENVRLHAFDLILLDIVMPGMDGFEVCRRLKRDPATRDMGLGN